MPNRRLHFLLLTAIIIPVGVAWRMAPLHLPAFAYKYGGSILWALMVYCLVAAALPRRRPITIALIAALISAIVEFSRLLHPPALDAFRLTLAGKLLLGRFFSLRDIAAYWLAIAAALLADDFFSCRRNHPTFPSRQRQI